ncbi:hypothetical protein D3C78_738900 [compost metagenome]
MANNAFTSHLGIGDFRQQARLQPVHTACLGSTGGIEQWWALRRQWLEPGMEAVEGGCTEAGAHLAGVTQLAFVFVMQGQQQRAETVAAAFGVGVADDDEFLSLLAFEFDPVTAASTHVDAVQTLADQAFELHTAGAVEQRLDWFIEVGRKCELGGRVVLQQRLQADAPFLQRTFA